MRQYWIRQTESLDERGNPVAATAMYHIMKGQGPKAVVVDKGTSKDWAVEYVEQLNLDGNHKQLKEDFEEVLDTMHRLAYHLDATTEHIVHAPSKKNAQDLIRRAQQLHHTHKKEAQQ